MIGDMFNDLLLFSGDAFLGWSLRITPDLTVTLLALLTALLLTLVRWLATDQDWLRRCRADKRRLAELRRERKGQGDAIEVQRLRQVEALLALKQLRAEIRPLLIALLPIALLGGWAWQRLEFLPPPLETPLTFTAHFPLSAAGQLAFVRPQRELKIEPAFIQEIKPSADPQAGGAQCVWTIAVKSQGYEAVETPVTLRWQLEGFEHPLHAGGGDYAPPVVTHSGGITTALNLRRYHAFGIIPNLPDLWLPSWLLGYLLMAVPAAFAFKRVFRVA